MSKTKLILITGGSSVADSGSTLTATLPSGTSVLACQLKNQSLSFVPNLIIVNNCSSKMSIVNSF
jgi:hypothetical protein